MPNTYGQYDKIVGISRVIDDRKKMEAYILNQHHKIQESEKKYKYLTENSRDII